MGSVVSTQMLHMNVGIDEPQSYNILSIFHQGLSFHQLISALSAMKTGGNCGHCRVYIDVTYECMHR